MTLFVALSLTDVSLCPVAALTGIPCPGCGLTRATLALASGDVVAALRFHPMSPAVLAFLLGTASLAWVNRRHPVDPSSLGARAARLLPWIASALLAALLAVWVARFLGAFGGPVRVQSGFHLLRR